MIRELELAGWKLEVEPHLVDDCIECGYVLPANAAASLKVSVALDELPAVVTVTLRENGVIEAEWTDEEIDINMITKKAFFEVGIGGR